jgi:hypothetical protein
MNMLQGNMLQVTQGIEQIDRTSRKTLPLAESTMAFDDEIQWYNSIMEHLYSVFSPFQIATTLGKTHSLLSTSQPPTQKSMESISFA